MDLVLSQLGHTGKPILPQQWRLSANLPIAASSCHREALARRAAGPEAFFAMRGAFAASLAAVAATNYVAGVGDRHLANFLLHEATGMLVPIDFG